MQRYLEQRSVFESYPIVQDAGYRRAQKRAQRERRRPDSRQQTVSVYVVRETAFTAEGLEKKKKTRLKMYTVYWREHYHAESTSP